MVDFNQSSQYTLSIRVSADGFCFALHHPEQVGEYAFMPYEVDPRLPVPANLKRAKESLSMLSHTYGHTNLLIVDSPYTLVPAEYCSPEAVRDMYLQNFPLTPSHQQVECGDVCGGKVKLLYAVDKALMHWADILFPGAVVSHSLQPILTYLINAGARSFLVNIHEKKADVIYVDAGRLQFANTFDYANPDDAAYYVLGVWQALGLSQTDDALTLAGKASDLRALRRTLERFVRHVDVVQRAAMFHGTELARLDSVPFDLCTLVSR